MKLFTLSLIALSSLASVAFANLGDTHQQSAARYGKTYRNDGFTGLSIYAPLGKGWMIYEWYNENGIVESIMYYQANGKRITQKQCDQLTDANKISVSHWNKATDDAAGTIWMSDDNNWRIELSWDASFHTDDGRPLHRLVISTGAGFLGMYNSLKGQPATTTTTAADLPVSL
jgi:hypothetical protein